MTQIPKWLVYALLSAVGWGVWALLVKAGSGGITPQALQILFVSGMIPLVAAMVLRRRLRISKDARGISYGIANGVLASLGMVAFYVAMERGRASVVGPVTALFPLFTVAGAVALLRERLNWVQALGIVFAIAAIAVLA